MWSALRVPRGVSRVGIAAVVAGFLDQRFGLFEMLAGFGAVAVTESEAGGGEVVVGEVEPHTGAGRDAEDFVDVTGLTAGEEAPDEEIETFAEITLRS